MGFHAIAVDGSISSWGSANFYSVLLSKFGPMSATLNMTSAPIDVTQLGVTAAVNLQSLREWTATMRGYTATTASLGNVGIIATSGSEYILHCDRWRVNLECRNSIDITDKNVNDTLGTGAPLWKRYRPDISGWTAAFSCTVDSATAATLPTAAGASLSTLTFTFASGTTLAGSSIVKNADLTIEPGNKTKIDYLVTGSGPLTPAGSNNPLGTTALGVPTWTAGGSTAGALVINAVASTTRTYSGYDSFWKRLSIECAINQPVMLEAEVQGSGAVTIA